MWGLWGGLQEEPERLRQVGGFDHILSLLEILILCELGKLHKDCFLEGIDLL